MKRAFFSSLAIIAFIAAAKADDTSPTKAVASSKTNSVPTKLPDVIVTAEGPAAYHVPDASAATKIETPVIQTPVSVQVIPLQVLQDQQDTRLDQALQNVSGVIQNNDSYGTGDSFSIRGFDSMEETYEDGLKLDQYSTGGLTRSLANVDSIEVVKGPASVLYGRAEPGGLVSIVTKKPLDDPYYSLDQEVGSYDFYRTTLDATGPLNTNKTFLYRFNLDYENSRSFRDFVHDDRFFIFPTLEWRPNDRNQAILELQYGTGTEVLDNGIPFLTNGTPANVPINRNYAEPNSNAGRSDDYVAKLSLEHDFNDDWKARLVYKFEYHHAPYDNIVDYDGDVGSDGTPGDLQRYWFPSPSSDSMTHQVVIDLVGKFETFGVKHTVDGGFDYYRADEDWVALTPPNAPTINIYNPVYSQPFPAIDYTNDYLSAKLGQYAWGAYVQDQLELPWNIHVLAGFRYDQGHTFENYYAYGGNLIYPTSQNDRPAPTPRVGILWQPVPQASLYATYTENFGDSPLGNTPVPGQILPPESAQQYEFGIKTEWFEKRLSATASIYQLTKQNIPTADPANPNYTIAIGEARSQGFEFDLAGQVTKGLRVIGSYSYIDCVTTQDNNTPSFQGLRFPGVPLNSASLWTTYKIQGGPLKGFQYGAGVVYRDPEIAWESPTGTSYQANHIPSYTILNAMASYGWKIGKTKLTAQLNINNLFDRTYFSSVNPSQAMPGEPFNVLGSLKLDF